MCSWTFLEVCVQLRDDGRFGLNIIVSQHLNELFALRGCRRRLSKNRSVGRSTWTFFALRSVI